MYEEHSGTAKKGGYSVYGYDGKGLDLSYKIDYDYNSNSAFTALFQREYLKVNGMAISQREIELPRYFDADQTRFLFTDALGSVTSVKSVSGGDEKIRYDAWGGFLEKYGRTGHIEEYSKRGVLLGYNGKPYDSFTGLYNYGYRHLSTDSKQWLTQDPIRDGSNWHAYLGGVSDPVNCVDLWGLKTIVIITKDKFGPFLIGSHVAVYVDNPTDEPMLFDPAGSYNPKDEYGYPVRGSDDILYSYTADPLKYIEYQKSTGSRVVTYTFNTTSEEEKRIFNNAVNVGGSVGGLCATVVNNVLRGNETFKNMGVAFTPGGLEDELEDCGGKRKEW